MTKTTSEIIEQERRFIEQEKRDNENQLKLNIQIMQVLNEKPTGVMGTALSELNQRKQARMRELDKLESDIKLLKDKEGILLTQLQNKYKAQFNNLQEQRNLLVNEHKLLLDYQSQIETLRKQQQGYTNLRKSTEALELSEKQTREEYKALYNQVGINKQLIGKLKEQLDKHILLKKKVEQDKELNDLLEECMIEIVVDRGSKIVTRSD